MGLYKQGLLSNLDLVKMDTGASTSKGTIAGEGATFFLLANDASDSDYAKLDGLKTIYKPGSQADIEGNILSFLAEHSISMSDIDLVITGKNGDAGSDEIYDQLAGTVFKNKNTIHYKHLCGEYPTSSAFALWMAANIIKTSAVPEALNYSAPQEKKINRVLIYNHYQGLHHSLFLLSAC
jgi:hypothetical protein